MFIFLKLYKNMCLFIKILISILLILILILILLKKNYINIYGLTIVNIILLLLFLNFFLFLLRNFWFIGNFLVTYYIEQVLTYFVMLNSIILELFKRSSRPNLFNLQFIPIILLFTINFTLCEGVPNNSNNTVETICLLIFFYLLGYSLGYVYHNYKQKSTDEYEEFINSMTISESKSEQKILLKSISEFDLFYFLNNLDYLFFGVLLLILIVIILIVLALVTKFNYFFNISSIISTIITKYISNFKLSSFSFSSVYTNKILIFLLEFIIVGILIQIFISYIVPFIFYLLYRYFNLYYIFYIDPTDVFIALGLIYWLFYVIYLLCHYMVIFFILSRYNKEVEYYYNLFVLILIFFLFMSLLEQLTIIIPCLTMSILDKFK